MSHFTTLKTRIVSKPHLLQALEDLAVAHEDGDLEILGYQGIRTPVNVRIPTSNPQYQIGFRKQGESYEMVADWYGVQDRKQEEFLGKILQRYAYLVAKQELENQDFTVIEEEIRQDNTIHLTLRRML